MWTRTVVGLVVVLGWSRFGRHGRRRPRGRFAALDQDLLRDVLGNLLDRVLGRVFRGRPELAERRGQEAAATRRVLEMGGCFQDSPHLSEDPAALPQQLV